MTDDAAGLDRFRRAQDHPLAGQANALREMQAGAKRSHWIWYVLPQLAWLGTSGMARTYGIRDRAEAEAYLRDDVLRERLADIVAAVTRHVVPPGTTPLASLMGSDIDARKLVSSLTLFEDVARTMAADDPAPAFQQRAELTTRVLDALERQGYDRCAFTRAQLAGR